MSDKNNIVILNRNRAVKKHSAQDTALIEKVASLAPSGAKGIATAIDASHTGFINNNFRNYTADSYQKVAHTFINPSPKPVFKNHNPLITAFGSQPGAGDQDPIGRVMAWDFINGQFRMPDRQSSDGLLKLGAFISDKEEVEKIMDMRHFNTSIGFKMDKAVCSLCDFDHMSGRFVGSGDGSSSEEPDDDNRCTHIPGRLYKPSDSKREQSCFLNVDMRAFREISVVAEPADVLATINAYQTLTDNESDFDNMKLMVDSESANEIQMGFTYERIGNAPQFQIPLPDVDSQLTTDTQAKRGKPMTPEEIKALSDGISQSMVAALVPAFDKLQASVDKLNATQDEPSAEGTDAGTGDAPAADDQPSGERDELIDTYKESIAQKDEASKIKDGLITGYKSQVADMQDRIKQLEDKLAALEGQDDQAGDTTPPAAGEDASAEDTTASDEEGQTDTPVAEDGGDSDVTPPDGEQPDTDGSDSSTKPKPVDTVTKIAELRSRRRFG